MNLTWRQTEPGTLTCVEHPEFAIKHVPKNNRKMPYLLVDHYQSGQRFSSIADAKSCARAKIADLVEIGIL